MNTGGERNFVGVLVVREEVTERREEEEKQIHVRFSERRRSGAAEDE